VDFSFIGHTPHVGPTTPNHPLCFFTSPKPTTEENMNTGLTALLAFAVAGALPFVFATPAYAGEWTLADGANAALPGRKVDIREGDRLVAQFIYGQGQAKPYLHLYGQAGQLLTQWTQDQMYPHHRGIFIGWMKITSNLGTDDLWTISRGARMTVAKFEKLQGDANGATLVAAVEWRSAGKDDAGSDLLLAETRALALTRPEGKRTQVDAQFHLRAGRDLTLGGDLQHAGVHLRATKELVGREKEVVYLWSPDIPKDKADRVIAKELRWVRMVFPAGDRWYSAAQFNAPSNPVEQLSARTYGRFGFFFQKDLKADEVLKLSYRFVVEPAEAPAETGKLSAEQAARHRAECDTLYQAFVDAAK
jgi:hypothetical protein